MRQVFLLLIAATAWAAEPDPYSVVRKALAYNSRILDMLRNYAFVQRVEERQKDAGGRIKSTEVETYDILILYGEPYRRLTARDDKPLSPKDQKKEEDKLAKLSAKRQRETPAEREKRLAEFRREREKERAFLNEIPDAFLLRVQSEQVVDGRPVLVIDAEPRPDYRPKESRAKMLSKFRGQLWIDPSENRLVKVQAEAIATVSFGLVLARLAKGSHFEYSMMRVNDEMWAPRSLKVDAEVRLALVKKLRGEIEVTYSDYKKFQTDSKIVGTSEIP